MITPGTFHHWQFIQSDFAAQLPDIFRQLTAENLVKANLVRKVWQTREHFVKIDFRSGRALHQEYRNCLRLAEAGLPAVRPEAVGIGKGCGVLITKRETGCIDLSEYLRTSTPSAVELEKLLDFVALCRQKGLRHSDLHSGNILFQPETCRYLLVDVRDARIVPALFASSRDTYLHLLFECRKNLSKDTLLDLISRLGYRDPEKTYQKQLALESRKLWKNWPKRQKQILSGYRKFTRLEDDTLYAAKCHIAPSDCETETNSQRAMLVHIFLELAHIPHLAVCSASSRQVLREKAVDLHPAESGEAADYQMRLKILGFDSQMEDWQIHRNKITLVNCRNVENQFKDH